jgi:Putative transmembrane family 234
MQALPFICVGVIWGVTNPLIKRGSIIAKRAAQKTKAQQWRAFLSCPSYLLPQARARLLLSIVLVVDQGFLQSPPTLI